MEALSDRTLGRPRIHFTNSLMSRGLSTTSLMLTT